MELNEQQLDAVTERDHCLVVATAGSGKTKVLETKTAVLIKEDPSTSVLSVTFTRDAANELARRSTAKLGRIPPKEVLRTGNFHSLALWQLKIAQKRFNIADAATTRDFVVRAMHKCGKGNMEYDEVLHLIEHQKASLAAEINDDSDEGMLAHAYNDYLRRNHLIDFQDMIRMAVLGMRAGNIKPYPCEHLLVDEFQDCDEVQYEWLREHIKNGAKLTCVGDDDQSIYVFRRSLGYEGMMRFVKETGARIITLNTNYRSHKEILSTANKIIRHNRERVPKDFEAFKGEGGKVVYERYAERQDEASAIVDLIRSEYHTNSETGEIRVPQGEWAILARNNHNLNHVEAFLTGARILCYRAAGKSFWEHPIVSVYLALLVSIETMEKKGFDRAIHLAGVSDTTLHALHQRLGRTGRGLLSGDISAAHCTTDQGESEKIESFMKCAAGWHNNLLLKRYDLTLHTVASWVGQHAKKDGDKKLLDIAIRVLCAMNDQSVAQRIAKVTGQRRKDEKTGIALYTIHAAKGLEWDNTWLISCEEGVIPSDRSPEEEERRLMFVGTTRAKKRMFITWTGENPESRFVVDTRAVE